MSLYREPKRHPASGEYSQKHRGLPGNGNREQGKKGSLCRPDGTRSDRTATLASDPLGELEPQSGCHCFYYVLLPHSPHHHPPLLFLLLFENNLIIFWRILSSNLEWWLNLWIPEPDCLCFFIYEMRMRIILSTLLGYCKDDLMHIKLTKWCLAHSVHNSIYCSYSPIPLTLICH